MCGIAGIIDINGKIASKTIGKMTNIVKHRGPDDEGYFLVSDQGETFHCGQDSVSEIKKTYTDIQQSDFHNIHVALGHRRLSIIDLTADGHQPMKFDQLVLIYNGEIYNYLEIQKELKLLGVEFKTHSDSEVVVRAYQYWGESCVEHFDGMWSFAIWDSKHEILFCSRDRFGEKPFHYYYDGTQFIFGSEIKQILAAGVPFEVHEPKLYEFLNYDLVNSNDNQTFFQHIYQLKAGHNLMIRLDKANHKIIKEEKAYYQLVKKEVKEKSYPEVTQKMGELLEKSIKYRLRSDVAVGSCLSGGLDSSSIVTLATDQLKIDGLSTQNFKTFSAMYDDHPEVDERYYSNIITKDTQTKNHEIKPQAQTIVEDFKKLVWHQEEPFPGLSIFAGWEVMKKAHQESMKVLLDGQGGDETLLGYSRTYNYLLSEKLKKIQFKSSFKLLHQLTLNNDYSLLGFLKETLYFNFKSIRKLRKNFQNKYYINKQYLDETKNYGYSISFKHKSLQFAQYHELTNSIQSLLRYEDRNAMAFSIETRLPFLSHEFVDYCYSVKGDFKLKEGWSKSLLRSYMADKMDNEVVYRKRKLGFSVPSQAWLKELETYTNQLFNEPLQSEKYFNLGWIKKNISNPRKTGQIFNFIIIETWIREFSKFI